MSAHDHKPGHARNAAISAAAAIIALALAACASTATTDSVTITPATASPGASAVTITGSGSTFDAPFFDLAFARYHQRNPAVTIRYSAAGSSAGIAAFSVGQVNFGASDVPLTAAEQAASHGGASVQVPVDLGAEVVVYNLVLPGGQAAAERPGDRTDLPRPDHSLERPGHRGPQPRY
jgi:ABC-type phosphate transport system substrate-binding protein